MIVNQSHCRALDDESDVSRYYSVIDVNNNIEKLVILIEGYLKSYFTYLIEQMSMFKEMGVRPEEFEGKHDTVQ